MQSFDVVIVGAGAAGLFCAGVAGQLGLKVLVLDHSEKVAEKIRISGGGRANFTNMDVTAANFLSENPRFAKSALSRFTPADFVALVKKHGIAFHEKHKGQLFCDRSAEDLIAMLLAITGPGAVPYQLGQPMHVYDANVLLGTLDPVPVGNAGTEIHIEHFQPTRVVRDEQRHVGRLVFLEICAFISEHFHQANVQPGVMGRREFVFPHEVAGNGPPNDAGNDEPEHAARSANLQCVVDTQPLDEIRHPCQRGTDTPDQRHGADQ